MSPEQHSGDANAESPSSPTRKSLADEYLQQACEALRASGSADGLYAEEARLSDKPLVAAAGRALAPGRRVGHSRTALLFAALACEAFINEFLDEHLSGADLAAVDRLPTLEKYVLGPRLATGADLFSRGSEPAQSIRELFRLRDRLVHSKPREMPTRGSVFDDPADFGTCNPEAAARFIVAVAQAAERLAGKSLEPTSNFAVLAIVMAPQLVLDFGTRAKDVLPDVHARAVEDLVMQAVQQVTGRSRDYVTPQDSDS
jgi:hypothetical protein